MRRSPNMNSPVQKGDRHARVAEPIPRPMVLQIPRGMGTEVSEAGDLRPDATWDWENRSGTMSAARRGVDRGSPLSDHVHVLLGIPPKFSVANTVGFLKGKSAIRIHREYLGRQRNFTGYHFWAGIVRLTLRPAQCRDEHSPAPLPSASLSARNHQPCRLALPQILHELPGC